MKPVMQTRFGVGEGNCLNACVASLLELPLGGPEGVPEENDGPLRRWLWERDMGIVWVEKEPNGRINWPYGGSFFLAAGPSPRNPEVDHAVVYGDHFKLAHDPHPDATGLPEVTEWGFIVRMGGCNR